MADRKSIRKIILPGGTAMKDAELAAVEHPCPGDIELLTRCCRELDEYFSGRRRQFSVPVHIDGTPFQQRAWRLLTRIPYGKTASYSDLAEILGNKKAARAVGRAAGANPLPIIIPCHRLIGRDGALTGFASGLDNKTWLLRHEGALITDR